MAKAPAEHAESLTEVSRLLDSAVSRRVSDIHFDPEAEGFVVRWRIDGLLEPVHRLPEQAGRAYVTRLMVMARLLTYRLDIPQEGRISHGGVEMRLAVMPTVHGLRAVLRLPAELHQPRSLAELQLGDRTTNLLHRFAATDQGMLLLTGPAGSGKTTTIYALLDHIATTQPGLSIVTLEDPVERNLPGVTQIEVRPHGELTYERALRSIVRQDPQVLMLGEIRDRDTAGIAVQAALSGHRLIATLHAGSPAGTITRLIEMGIEPYQITSALYGVVAQRLVRLAASGGGYAGRAAIAEAAAMTESLRRQVLARADARALTEAIEGEAGHENLRSAAGRLVEAGVTDAAEVDRVLGA